MAAARDAAIAGLLAEVTVTDDIEDTDDIDAIGEEDRVEDEDDRAWGRSGRALAPPRTRRRGFCAGAATAADARSARRPSYNRGRARRERRRGKRLAAPPARSSRRARPRARPDTNKALTHRLANREAALERAAIEMKRGATRTCRAGGAATRAANATLTALVSDRDTQLATTRHELERSETQNVESLLVEVALQTAHEETRDALAKEKAARVSERDRHETALAVARRREETTKARFAQSQRRL